MTQNKSNTLAPVVRVISVDSMGLYHWYGVGEVNGILYNGAHQWTENINGWDIDWHLHVRTFLTK